MEEAIQKVIDNQFRNFQKKATVLYSDSDSICSFKTTESDIGYDLSEIHRIKPEEFDSEGYFFILCTQAPYWEIKEMDIEIWKVYKTEKCYHVLEWCKNFARDYFLYNYYDYDHTSYESYLWRNSTEILGIKLPDDFEMR